MNEDWLASYLPLIKYLRSLLTQHHKKSYTISVGKLNPAKLANFLEVECYVLVACPENSLIDAKVSEFRVSVGHVRRFSYSTRLGSQKQIENRNEDADD
jgi:hypothetical protein